MKCIQRIIKAPSRPNGTELQHRLKYVVSQEHINGGIGEIVQGRGLKLCLRIRHTWFLVPVPLLNCVTLAKLLNILVP